MVNCMDEKLHLPGLELVLGKGMEEDSTTLRASSDISPRLYASAAASKSKREAVAKAHKLAVERRNVAMSRQITLHGGAAELFLSQEPPSVLSLNAAVANRPSISTFESWGTPNDPQLARDSAMLKSSSSAIRGSETAIDSVTLSERRRQAEAQAAAALQKVCSRKLRSAGNIVGALLLPRAQTRGACVGESVPPLPQAGGSLRPSSGDDLPLSMRELEWRYPTKVGSSKRAALMARPSSSRGYIHASAASQLTPVVLLGLHGT